VVFIIVAVQQGLNNIKEALSARGYEVVEAESYNYPIDALVYEGTSFQISYISRNNMPEVSMGPRPNYGVFIINSSGKSIEEVDEMLKMRCYSHLF
jgi:hypothetical protein